MTKKKMNNLSCCPMIHAMNIIGNKWSPIIIYILGERKMRFGQLVAHIENISRKVLTEQLKELERCGVVYRHAFSEIPPRVEYSLTTTGKKLLPILEQICTWGEEISVEKVNG